MIREATGVVADLKGIAATGLRAVRTRLELLAIELSQEKAWAVRSLIVAIGALYLLTFGLLLGVFALVLFAAEENRPAILATCAGVFLLAGIGGATWIWRASKSRSPIFEATIAVLKGDEQGLHELMRGTGD